MIKRIIYVVFALLFLTIVCAACESNSEDLNNDTTDFEKSNLFEVEQNEYNYVVYTEWMLFYFSKKDYQKENIVEIVNEAVGVMEDVRNYLGLNYSLDNASETECFFDSEYYNNGQNRSYCYMAEKKMYCVSLVDFVHEYVHMVSGNCEDLVYQPDEIFVEGLAQYVSFNFCDVVASVEYKYFRELEVVENSDSSEHGAICELIYNNKLEYNIKNYNKALVAFFDEKYSATELNKKSDFYKYQIGYVFVDYCINRLGGFDKFIVVYCDSLTIDSVYGSTIDELIIEACEYNTILFNKNLGKN